MRDLRAGLERLGRRLAPAPDAFDRLTRARARRARGRRITAGVVAVTLTIAGSLVVLAAFGGGSTLIEDDAPPTATGSDTLRVTCEDRSIAIGEPAVVAQPAGVHVIVENGSRDALFFQFAPRSEGPWGGTEVGPGSTELALQAPPGSMTIRCSDGDGTVTEDVVVDVHDVDALFVPFDLECPGQSVARSTIPSSHWPDGGPSTSPEPISFVRQVTEGLLPSDVVELAAYPEAPVGIVRVLRDGAVVAQFGLFKPDDWAPGMVDGWAAGGTWCPGSGISIPPGPDPYPRGWFEWCPEGPFPEGGRDWSEHASEVAVRFARAYVDDDRATLDAVLDASVPPGAEFNVVLAEGTEPKAGHVDAHGGEVVNYSCGNDVDAYTVAVTIDDGTDSASLDFTVYLVLRDDGWKVWGVY